ncbi:MAG: tyrosine-type recombinase/integrase, partial [Blautia sp.]|nr:tyrosine-type recombinase/integrase [Blautia sp.]
MKRIIIRYNKEHPDAPLPIISPHGLRHTSASLSIYAGSDPEAVSKRLGHSRTSTTMDIYAHAFEQADQDAAEGIERVWKGKTNAG